ncbi:hypothetical protein CYMTET_39722 [Cymbomonas tetramitiformis]|uniref:Uncharacterized protein n=1 Tax=Cymbomonas tetramitiformis TaxID=36881 RepID=A0AAE0CAY8_9CHLO|nr:hypothetical protein CYMTET_39722 [Cymbomonas tetramitiformis]
MLADHGRTRWALLAEDWWKAIIGLGRSKWVKHGLDIARRDFDYFVQIVFDDRDGYDGSAFTYPSCCLWMPPGFPSAASNSKANVRCEVVKALASDLRTIPVFGQDIFLTITSGNDFVKADALLSQPWTEYASAALKKRIAKKKRKRAADQGSTLQKADGEHETQPIHGPNKVPGLMCTHLSTFQPAMPPRLRTGEHLFGMYD